MTAKKETDASSDQNQTVNVPPAAEDGAENQPAPSPDESGEDPEQKLEAAQLEAQQNFDRLLRLSAEFENYKKRMVREMADYRKYALERVFKEMIGVVDNLERAIQSTTGQAPDAEAIADGVQMTLSETLRVFNTFGVEPIEAVGKPFDPAFHQAVAQEENDQFEDNTVLNELQKGYLLNDRLLRASMVVVSKNTPPEGSADDGDQKNDKSHIDKE